MITNTNIYAMIIICMIGGIFLAAITYLQTRLKCSHGDMYIVKLGQHWYCSVCHRRVNINRVDD
jgi:hypothetical protein